MDELRLVRREEQSLIVATETGDEFRLVVDETVLAELRSLSRRSTSDVPVRPREIQALLREGKTRDEIMEITGLVEDDIERYEEPVLAERRYILERAQAVAVRTGTGEEGSEQFGAVIGERLLTLGAEDVEWLSWRDPEAGWIISLTFMSHGVAYRAEWSFEHRKGVLAPISPDAVNLSKQGEVGDRLIPKLRAVDTAEASQRFDAHTFDDEDATDADDTADLSSHGVGSGHPSAHTMPDIDDEAEFARRREIEQRAISTTHETEQHLGQTADLLDALRRRRGERESGLQGATTEQGLVVTPDTSDAAPIEPSMPRDAPAPSPVEHRDQQSGASDSRTDDAPTAQDSAESAESAERGGRSKRRTSIPSWDDILFGTRSDEDPVS